MMKMSTRRHLHKIVGCKAVRKFLFHVKQRGEKSISRVRTAIYR